MQTDKHDLPKGWISISFEYVRPSTIGFDPTKEENQRYVGLEHIEKDTGRIIGSADSKTTVSSKTVFKKGDLLYGKLRPYLNKVVIPDFDGVCSTDILVFPKNPFIINTLLKFCLLKSDFVRFANATVAGVQHPRTSHKKLSEYLIPIPPFNEQKRIVSKIESIFAQIDACKERLEQLTATTATESSSLAQLKSSVLKQAFEGKLISQDPNDDSAEEFLQKIHQDSRQELIFEKNGLPRGWIKTKMGNLVVNSSVDIVDGPFGSNLKAAEYVEMGIPLIRLQNVARNQFVNKNIKYITKDKAESLKRHNFKVNDIIITKLGKPLGESCLVPNYLPSGIIVADIVRVRISHDLISRKFLVYAINSDQLARQFVKYTKGTTRPRVNLTKIRELMIPLPPLPEQHRIVAKIESIFARIDATDQLVRDSLIRLELLKKSVLRKAFEGRLVPQDPRDEPVEMLLQRIKQEQKPRKNRNVK